ncbi:MAG: S41 family peptidase [Dehalococcoidales bacterium]|jgi:carboxyl-terminal processing protease
MFKGLKVGALVAGTLMLLLVFGCNLLPGASSTAANFTSNGDAKVSEAWDIIFENYVEKDSLDPDHLSEAAIRGMLEAIDDPHTSYLDVQNYELSRSSFDGELGGIGAQVGVRDGELVIIAPIAGSPAEKAGIRAGDIIVAADGQPISEMSYPEAILKIRGHKGTVVNLLVLHQGETEPVEIEITRDTITVSSVQFEMVDDVAYIGISLFSDRTDDEMSEVLSELPRQGATGIILDLRGNPGGLLTTVTRVTSFFLDEGVVLKVKDNRGEITEYPVEQTGQVTDLPMVVLVDGFSASGSEVLAGALQDYGRATLAGSTTFGKGSINRFYPLKDGSGLYVTVARWLTPLGRPIEGEGLVPDIEFELTGDAAVQWAVDYLNGTTVLVGAGPLASELPEGLAAG